MFQIHDLISLWNQRSMHFILIAQICIRFKISYLNIWAKYPPLRIMMKKQDPCPINPSVLYKIQTIQQFLTHIIFLPCRKFFSIVFSVFFWYFHLLSSPDAITGHIKSIISSTYKQYESWQKILWIAYHMK